MSKPWSNLAKIVYKRTYARNDFGTGPETWQQTVDRVINGNLGKYRGTDKLLPNEEERLRYFMLNRKATPAGRGLWFSGAPAEKPAHRARPWREGQWRRGCPASAIARAAFVTSFRP
jgi:hypothetical protein